MKPTSATIALLLAALFVAGAAAPAKRQLQVAYVLDSAVGPHDFRQLALRGFQRAVKDLGVRGRVVQLNPSASAGATLTALARQRYDLVLVGVARGPQDMDEVAAVAARFPQATFVMSDTPLFDRPRPWPRNVQGSLWRVEQASFLAGFLGGLMETRQPGRRVVGSVGALPVPQIDTFIAGYEAGARKVTPRITVLRDYAENFFDTSKCEAVARRQIGKGAGVIFNVAGVCGLGTMRAAQAGGAWAIGVDVDQSYLGRHVLTSVLKRWDVQAYDTIEAYVDGALKTGVNRTWNLRNAGVGLGRISPRVPPSFVRQVERIRAQIVTGKIRVSATLS
jgi:basic membrane protein A